MHSTKLSSGRDKMTIGRSDNRDARGERQGPARARVTTARRAFVVLALLAASALVGVAQLHAGGDWNDGQIAWQPYDKGFAAAKEQKKPICLVVYTEWCPHCANYSKVLHENGQSSRAAGKAAVTKTRRDERVS